MTLDDLRKSFDFFDQKPFAKGGQKEVYAARHPEYGDVVVKILNNVDERANREIELLSKFGFHDVPRIYAVHDIELYGNPTIAVIEERIEGEVVRSIINSGRRYSLYEAADFVENMLNIINEVWSRRVVHRDIKPENIIRRSDGHYILLDFGIARMLDRTSITSSEQNGPLTPGYAAPEIIQEGKSAIDTRSDLFSIGVVTYELVKGYNPFTKNANNIFQMLYNTTTITPVFHTLPGDVQHQFMGLVSSMMSRDQFARPANAEEALRFLANARTTFA